MAREKVKQRYFIAKQEVVDGNTVLTLLQEEKDTSACHNTMKSDDFGQKYGQMDTPVRVCILRDEPALMIQARPSELAEKIRAEAGDKADSILAILNSQGVATMGELEVVETSSDVVMGQTAPQTAEVQPQAVPAPAPVSPAPPKPTAPTAPQEPPPPPEPKQQEEDKFVDANGIVPKGYQTLSHPELVRIAQKITPDVDGTVAKLACIAIIARYLETGELQTDEPKQEVVDYTAVPPGEGFELTNCEPGACGCVVWKDQNGKLYDAVEGYPEHVCPATQKAAPADPPAPTGPPAPPAQAAPAPAPAAPVTPPPVVAPPSGFANGGAQSGQAPGVPPIPPPPPPQS